MTNSFRGRLFLLANALFNEDLSFSIDFDALRSDGHFDIVLLGDRFQEVRVHVLVVVVLVKNVFQG